MTRVFSCYHFRGFFPTLNEQLNSRVWVPGAASFFVTLIQFLDLRAMVKQKTLFDDANDAY